MVEAGLWLPPGVGGPHPAAPLGLRLRPAKARRHQHKKHRIRGLEFGPNRGTGRLRFLPVLSQGPFPVCTASGQGDVQGRRGSGRGVWVLSAVRTSRDGRGRSRPTGTRSSHRTKAGGAVGRRPGALTPRPPVGAQVCRALRPDPPRARPCRAPPLAPSFSGSPLSVCSSFASPLPHFSASQSLPLHLFSPHPLYPGSLCVLFCLQVALLTSCLLSCL